jgi:DNA-binding Lrp family transcriptional regulator
MAIKLDRGDRILLNHAQGDFPVCPRPFRELGERVGMSEEEVLSRLRRLVDAGAISRLGPILDAPRLGGERTLAAMHVPSERFDEVASFINSLPSISHNYEREHHLNLWFVVSSEDEAEIARTLRTVQEKTGLEVLNLPAEEEYFLEVRFQFPVDDAD